LLLVILSHCVFKSLLLHGRDLHLLSYVFSSMSYVICDYIIWFFESCSIVLEANCMLLVCCWTKFEICVCYNFFVWKWGHNMGFFCFDLVMWLKSHKLCCIMGFKKKMFVILSCQWSIVCWSIKTTFVFWNICCNFFVG